MRHEHGFQRDTPYAEAKQQFLDHLSPLNRSETVDIASARGRVLAEDVTAQRNVPHYDRTAMDGWAVRSDDTHGASPRNPRELVVSESGPVADGEAVRVHTGSAVPEGADAVVMIEDSDRHGDRLEVHTAVAEGRHVGAAGEDIEAGDIALQAGATITPSAIALFASLEVSSISVYERPSVAVIPTGEELVETSPAPGEVIETNGLMVTQYVESWGADANYRDIVTDDPAALEDALLADLDADLLITTGGSSVGARDYLPEVVEDIGDLIVHGVAVQPGHPVGLGLIDETPLAMLPGYPVSCVVNAHLFVRPAIRTLGGYRELPDPTREVELTEKITSTDGRRTITRVTLEQVGDTWLATPTMTSGAGILSSMAQTDAIVVVPESVEGYDQGATVTAEIWE